MEIQGLHEGEQILNARRVFGEPIVREDAVILPVAKIRGGAGGGNSPSKMGEGGAVGGEGGGFGLNAKPAGVYVVRGEKVRWIPSVDVNRIIAGGQLVAACALIAWGLSHRRRRLWEWRR
jgi:uncharacterized spore protein YtfJ